MAIKNIIFDLGGVIININYQLTANAFRDLGAHNFDEFYSQARQKELFDEFETGKITSDEFRIRLRSLLNLAITDDGLDEAWTCMLLDLPAERLAYLTSLKDAYRIFLFSNINAIHFKKMQNLRGVASGSQLFNGIFEREYYSHIFGMRKPHQDAFTAILKENNLVSTETLFIDDSIQHVRGAMQAGLHAVHLSHGKTILDFDELLAEVQAEIK